MKFSDRLEGLRPTPKRPGELRAEVLHRRRERREHLERQLAEERAKLTEADQTLAAVTRLPAAREDRVRLAHSLREAPGGRRRTYREIAAIMGVTRYVARVYFQDPEGLRPDQRRYEEKQKKLKSATPRKSPAKFEKVIAPPPPGATIDGTWIKEHRKRRRLSRVKLAQEVGVTADVIERWEAGEAAPTPAYAAALRRVLL